MECQGIGQRMNENDEMFIEFCDANNLAIGGSRFPNKKKPRSLLDVRNKRRPDVASDHHLIIGEISSGTSRSALSYSSNPSNIYLCVLNKNISQISKFNFRCAISMTTTVL